MKRENQRVVLTKRLLKEALLRLLSTQELSKINISQLCREAGINRVTFYHHYSTPRDVLVEMATDVSQDLKLLQPYPTTVAEAEAYLEHICRYLKEHSELVKLLIRCETDKDLTQVIWDINEQVLISNYPSRAGDQLDSEDYRLLTTFVVSGGYHMLRQWIMEDSRKTPAEIAHLICSIIRFDYIEMQRSYLAESPASH